MHVPDGAVAVVVELAGAAQRCPGPDIVPPEVAEEHEQPIGPLEEPALERGRAHHADEARQVAGSERIERVAHLGGVESKLVKEGARRSDHDATVPERTVRDPRHRFGLARLLHVASCHGGAALDQRHVGVERRTRDHVAEPRLRSRGADAERDERVLPCRVRRRPTERAPIRFGIVDREVGVHGDEDRARTRATRNLLRRPRERGGGAERPRFHQHILLGYILGDRADGRSDVATGEDQHPSGGHRGLQSAHRVLDQRLLGHQREQWLGPRRCGEGPESRPDAAGEDHRPQGDVGLRFAREHRLLGRERAHSRALGRTAGGEVVLSLHRLLR